MSLFMSFDYALTLARGCQKGWGLAPAQSCRPGQPGRVRPPSQHRAFITLLIWKTGHGKLNCLK